MIMLTTVKQNIPQRAKPLTNKLQQ